MRRSIAVAYCAAVAMMSVGFASTALADHCDVRDRNCLDTEGDQESGSIITTGVQFPGAEPGSDLYKATRQNSQCKDCEWSIVPACMQGSSEASGAACLGATAGCPDPSDIRFRVYMRQGGGAWQIQGTVCLGPGERPATVADVGEAIRTTVVNYLPDASPTFQPRSGGIVNLPTIFAVGEPRTITTEPFDVMGFTVVVTARARWEWTFEEGVTKDFAEPGGAYPDTSVSHTYDGPGARQVSVTTYWRGQFMVNGEGPFAIPGPEISKTAGPIAVPVREARSELVAG